ncbi:MAG: cytochrome d ubiquinol oxidase subunit II, partial [Gammaproteobacteria bacterium]
FPFIMPSSSHPNASLTLWDAVSSHRTLQIMFWVVLLFLPLIVVYTSWVYRVLRGRISITTIKGNERSLY